MNPPSRALGNFVAPLIALAVACTGTSTSTDAVPAPRPTESAPPTPSSRILLTDDFSDPGGGWSQVDSDNALAAYDGGALRILIRGAHWQEWSLAPETYGDVLLEVNATKVGGPDNNEFGLICRYQDAANFYGLFINSEGYYGIMRIQDDVQKRVGAEGSQWSDAIVQGAGTNRIQADCVGDALTLYVNGTELISARDSTFSTGNVGVIAGSYSESGVDIRFDDFVLAEP